MAKREAVRSQVIPENETKSARFARVVTPRVNKAVKAIEVVGYCAGATYEYTPKDVEQISEALFAAMAKLADVFGGKSSGTSGFALKK